MSAGLRGFHRWWVAFLWVYFTLLFLWAAMYVATGDRFAPVALLNNLAVYLFIPLPLGILTAWWLKRRELGLASGVAALIFSVLWGHLFLPSLHPEPAGRPALTVMTYNVLGRQTRNGPQIAVIEAMDADLIFLQEINHAHAAAFEEELGLKYPYQILDPVDDVTGMGVLSKYPLQTAQVGLPLDWVGRPQVLNLDWEGESIRLINFHMYPSGLGSLQAVAALYRAREEQARALADFAGRAARSGPVLAGGDANVTALSDAYGILSRSLSDAWQVGGFGLGHTFPGSAGPGSARPRIAGWPVPKWLARIDYVFYSRHWIVGSAQLAPYDGVSDHRGVLAEFHLIEPGDP